MASVTEPTNFKFYLIWINGNLNGHPCLVATVVDTTALGSELHSTETVFSFVHW